MLEDRVHKLEQALAYLKSLPMISEHIAEVEAQRENERRDSEKAAAAAAEEHRDRDIQQQRDAANAAAERDGKDKPWPEA